MLDRYLWNHHVKHDGCPLPNIFRFARDCLTLDSNQSYDVIAVKNEILSDEIQSSMRNEHRTCISSINTVFSSLLESYPESHPRQVQKVQSQFNKLRDWISTNEEQESRKRQTEEMRIYLAGIGMNTLMLLAILAVYPAISALYLVLAAVPLATLTVVKPVRDIVVRLILSKG